MTPKLTFMFLFLLIIVCYFAGSAKVRHHSGGKQECCLSLICAHCRGPFHEGCSHPSGFNPPFTECGAVTAKCGFAVIALTDMLSTHANVYFDMNFGIRGDLFVFKGCVTADYCTKEKSYSNFGAIRAHCEVCGDHWCNLYPDWEPVNRVNRILPFVIVYQLPLLQVLVLTKLCI